MNLAALQSTCYQRLGYSAAPPTATVAMILSYLNETHREILGMKGLTRLRRHILTFACTANSPFVVLPQAANRIIAITDRVNNWELTEIPLDMLRYADPGLQMSVGNPDRYVIMNMASAVAIEPSAAAEMFFKSDSATDDVLKKAYLEGVTATGYYRSVGVAMNGVTAVSFSAAITNWIKITKFYIGLTAGGSTTAVGNITLNQGSGIGTELARIPPGRGYTRYTQLQLYPTPTQANTYYADVELHIEEMANGGDEPLLPEDFHWLLPCGAMMKDYQRRQWAVQYGEEKARWKNGIGDLKINLARQTAGLQSNPKRFSQLGSYFPPGT